MLKVMLAGATALAIAGSTLVYAQQRPASPDASAQDQRGHHPRWQMSAEDAQAFSDARIAGLKAGLRLSVEQEKSWPAVEAAMRELAKDRIARMEAAPQGARRAWRSAARARHGRSAPPARRHDGETLRRACPSRRCRRAALQEPRRRAETPPRHADARHASGRSPSLARTRSRRGTRRSRPLRHTHISSGDGVSLAPQPRGRRR